MVGAAGEPASGVFDLEQGFLRRTQIMTIVGGILIGLTAVLLGHAAMGGGVAVGAAWGAANVWALSVLLLGYVRWKGKGGTAWPLLLAGFVKFPLLYALGFALLRSGLLPTAGLLAGFSLVFVIFGIETAGLARGRVVARNETGKDR